MPDFGGHLKELQKFTKREGKGGEGKGREGRGRVRATLLKRAAKFQSKQSVTEE